MKRQCLDTEGAEEALRQAQETVARLQRQLEEPANQVASPAIAPSANVSQQIQLPVPPATAPPQPASQQPVVVQQPLPAPASQSLSTQPPATASPGAPPPAYVQPAQSQATYRPPQPSFASFQTSYSNDNGFRGGRSRRGRQDTRGRMFYIYVCRNHSQIYCQICGEYLSAQTFFERNPDQEY